jgi:hypothetical protein
MDPDGKKRIFGNDVTLMVTHQKQPSRVVLSRLFISLRDSATYPAALGGFSGSSRWLGL